MRQAGLTRPPHSAPTFQHCNWTRQPGKLHYPVRKAGDVLPLPTSWHEMSGGSDGGLCCVPSPPAARPIIRHSSPANPAATSSVVHPVIFNILFESRKVILTAWHSTACTTAAGVLQTCQPAGLTTPVSLSTVLQCLITTVTSHHHCSISRLQHLSNGISTAVCSLKYADTHCFTQ